MAKKSNKKNNPGAIQLSKAEKLAQAQAISQEPSVSLNEKTEEVKKDENLQNTNSKPVKAEVKKSGKQKEKRQSVVLKKLKETGSELKKVTWPSFATVVKQTGVVIAVVIIFTIVIFGIDRALMELFKLLTPAA